jgi:uncharacterized protein YkwD
LPARPPRPKGWWRTSALALGVAFVLTATPTEASAAPTAQETVLLGLVNNTRTARGLKPLVLRDNLVRMAHRHSARMARKRALYHTPCLSCRFPSGSWRALAENVGMAGSLRRVHRLMMRSTGHRSNLLGAFDAIGIGVVKRSARFWVTEIFFA